MKRYLISSILFCAATAYATTPAKPTTVTDIHTRIQNSQQIILYAPNLKRIDITESLRRAMVQRGTSVILLTNRNNFWTENSLTLRLLYIGAKTYDYRTQDVPFMLLDGKLLTGYGITGAGTIMTDPHKQAQVIRWTNQYLKTHKPLDPDTQTAEWIRRAGLGPTESDLPPRTPPPLPPRR